MTASFIISSLLFLALVIAFPIWDLIETRGLRSASDSRARGFYYGRIMGVEWSLTLLVIALIGWRATMFFNTPVRPAWLPPWDTLVGLLIAFIAGLLIPSIMAWRSASANSFFAKQLAAIDYLLPKTPSQRVLFLLVSVTAGICEEVIFRAFAIHYLATVLPGASI